jgi:hypothetical protein
MKERISDKISEILNNNRFKPKAKKGRPTWNRDKYYVDKNKKGEERESVTEEGI